MRNGRMRCNRCRSPEHAVPSSLFYRSVMGLTVLSLILAAWHLAAWPQLVEPLPAPEGLLARASALMTVTAVPTPVATATASPEPAAEAQPAPAATAEQRRYTVQQGDMLGAIAAQFESDVDAIVLANNLANAEALSIGQELVIP